MKTELKIPESKHELKFPLLASRLCHNELMIVVFRDRYNGVVVKPVGNWYLFENASSFDLTFKEWTIHPPGTQLILTVE